MFQLREAVLKQRILSVDEFFSCVRFIFKYYLRWHVLEACNFKGLHHNFIMVARRTCLAVGVKADDFDASRQVRLLNTFFKFVLYRYLGTCT